MSWAEQLSVMRWTSSNRWITASNISRYVRLYAASVIFGDLGSYRTQSFMFAFPSFNLSLVKVSHVLHVVSVPVGPERFAVPDGIHLCPASRLVFESLFAEIGAAVRGLRPAKDIRLRRLHPD